MSILIKNVKLLDEYGYGNKSVNILIDGEKISYVGEDLPQGSFERVIDGRENLVIPAFYNAHCHAAMTVFRGYGDDLPLHEWLNDRIFPAEDRLTDKSVYLGTKLAVAEMIKNGVVSFSDMYMFEDSAARAVAECGVKANLSRSLVSFDPDMTALSCFRFAEAEKLVSEWDGACDGRIKVDFSLHAEYTNLEKYCREVGEYVKNKGLRMQLHASETEKEHFECIERHGTTPIGFFARAGVLDSPVTAAHCVWVDDSDIEILADKHVYVAHNPVSNLKLASGIMPYGKMKSAGVNIALGTDGVASNNRLDMIREIQTAALIHKGNMRNAKETAAADMIRMATRMGALSQGREDCGLIREGYRADLLLVDMHSIHNIPSYSYESTVCYSADSSDILMTVCDGRILYENGEYTLIDIERLKYDFSEMLAHYFD